MSHLLFSSPLHICVSLQKDRTKEKKKRARAELPTIWLCLWSTCLGDHINSTEKLRARFIANLALNPNWTSIIGHHCRWFSRVFIVRLLSSARQRRIESRKRRRRRRRRRKRRGRRRRRWPSTVNNNNNNHHHHPHLYRCLEIEASCFL